jgi:nucleoside-diphosphate-sugar epimerase
MSNVEINKKKILLLGSTGFIGQNLLAKLSETYEVLCLNRNQQLNDKNIESFKPDIIVNSAASAINADFQTSLESNLLLPLETLTKTLKHSEKKIKWIQLGSYFELQVRFGRTDYYSLHKKHFSQILLDAQKIDNFTATVLYLPHIVGPGEKPNRLFPTLIDALNGSDVLLGTNGTQHIPILSIWDCVSEIMESLKVVSGEYSIEPVFYNSLQKLVTEFFNDQNYGRIMFTPDVESIDARFPKLVLNQSLREKGKGKYTINEIIGIIRK